jgi:ABC-type nitrate/sulfonate/bicarbonate transport system substrate-binding protein
VEVAVLAGLTREQALERGGVRLLFSDYQLFGAFTAGTLVMTKRFLHDKPRAARKFVEATAKAIDWAQHAPREEVIARLEKIVAGRGRNEDPSALSYWRSTGVATAGGVIAKVDFQRWIDWMVREGEPEAAQVPLGELYTNELNPFWKGSDP